MGGPGRGRAAEGKWIHPRGIFPPGILWRYFFFQGFSLSRHRRASGGAAQRPATRSIGSTGMLEPRGRRGLWWGGALEGILREAASRPAKHSPATSHHHGHQVHRLHVSATGQLQPSRWASGKPRPCRIASAAGHRPAGPSARSMRPRDKHPCLTPGQAWQRPEETGGQGSASHRVPPPKNLVPPAPKSSPSPLWLRAHVTRKHEGMDPRHDGRSSGTGHNRLSAEPWLGGDNRKK